MEDNYFRGVKITEDASFFKTFSPFMEEINKLKQRQVAFIDRKVSRVSGQANLMGLLFCEAMMDDQKTDFCFINPGMIRVEFDEGPLIYDHIF